MKILYDSTNGKTYLYFRDKDWPNSFVKQDEFGDWWGLGQNGEVVITNPLTLYNEIDDPDSDNVNRNTDLIRDIFVTNGNQKVDINGDYKYYISAGVLYERENWEEYVEGP